MKPNLLLLTLLLPLLGAAPTTQSMQRDDVASLVQPYIDGGYLQCVVVGIIDANGVRVLGFGRVSDENPKTPDGDTVFEIGSVSKTFTSLLLADMVQRGLVQLDDPVQKYLPDSVHLKQKGRAITLLDLSTHRSGLPRQPVNMSLTDLVDPYAKYSTQMLYEALNMWEPTIAPGEHADYSNFGTGLLGQVLARRASSTYQELLVARITWPLKMSDTSITLNPGQLQRLAQGHDADGNPVRNWNFQDATAGAGGIRSTASDMLRYVQAQLKPPTGELGDAITLTHARRNQFTDQFDIGLGWVISKSGLILHDGATGGYRSLAAFDPDRQFGLVVLSNSGAGLSGSVALALMNKLAGIALPALPKLRKPIKLDPNQLDRFAGDYFTGTTLLTIRRDSDQLLARMMGQPEFRIFPESPTSFFWKAVDAQLDFTFGNDIDAKATRIVLHQNGQNTYLIRTPDSSTTKPASQPIMAP